MLRRMIALSVVALGASACGQELCADSGAGFDRNESGDAVEVRAGQGLTCARHADGRVSCWGAYVGAPTEVPGIANAASLTVNGASWNTNYVVLDSGEVYSWTLGERPLAFGVDGAMRFASFTTTRYGVACIMASGGGRERGWVTCQTSEGSLWKDGPVLRDFSTDGWNYCEVDDTGIASCWGRYVDFGGLSGVEQVAVGSPPCVRLTTGEVACWDSEIVGEPALVEGVDDAVDVSSGWGHACAVLSSGRVTCWGDNEYGQLGNGHRAEWDDSDYLADEPPSDVVDLDDAVQVTAGDSHTCALRSTGAVVCWGDAFPDEGRDECMAVSRPSTVTLPGR